jgi:hypothetical protein
MGLRLCTVSFKAATGIAHSVDVEAESLYEAAAIGLARLKSDGWIEGLGPGSMLEISVREPATHHSMSVERLNRWINGTTPSPAETLKKARVRALLADPRGRRS